MGIGDWGLGIGDWGLGPIPIYIYILYILLFNIITIYQINKKILKKNII